MPHTTAAMETRSADPQHRRTAAGPLGVSLAPPTCGIQFVDQAPADAGPVQRRLDIGGDRSELADPPRSNLTGLPDQLKAGVEQLSGFDLSDVRVHFNSSRPAQLQALAYAQGTDIHVAPGQERHLPHEAWHVVQQSQGRVKPTMQLKDGVAVNDDAGLEHEADLMGAKALARVSGPEAVATHAEPGPVQRPSRPVIQGKWFRMSTLLERDDEIEVAEIQRLVDTWQLFDAFWVIVRNYPDLVKELKILASNFAYGDARDAAFNILWETFEASKAYTAAEVIEELSANEIVTREADSLADSNETDEEIDDLILQFGNLNIVERFRSDADQGAEEHAVSWNNNDVIVASNPKPLKLVVAAGNWLGCVLTTSVKAQLTGLRKTAKLALYKIAGNAKRGITGSRTAGKMRAFRQALGSVANVLASLKGNAHANMLCPPTELRFSDNYGVNSAPIEGTHVKAAPLSINSAQPGSAPVDGRLMKSIRNLAGTQSKSYVQMHLLNDLVFGPGQLWNLTPGPKQSNVDMEMNVEDPLKRAVLGKGLVINFEAVVNYKTNPITASDTDIRQNPDKYRFNSIRFSAEQLEYDATTKTWGVAGVQDPDVKAVDGKTVNWRYGSLIPLVPKPRILSTATTWQELTTAGLQPAAAKRIVAFVASNPTWTPAGSNKQLQLAQAVKAFDNNATIPNISSWKATAVLWT